MGVAFPTLFFFLLMQDDAGCATHKHDQQFHIILAILLGTTIFAKLGNHYYFHYLVNLIDLDRVRHLN